LFKIFLLQEEKAIVTEVAGTNSDVIERIRLKWLGEFPLKLVDTG